MQIVEIPKDSHKKKRFSHIERFKKFLVKRTDSYT